MTQPAAEPGEGARLLLYLRTLTFQHSYLIPVPKKAKLEGGGEGPSEKYSALLGGVGEEERPPKLGRAHLGVRHGRGRGQMGASRRAPKWGGILLGPGGAGAFLGAGPEPPESGG